MGPLRRLIDDFLDPGLDDAAAEKYRHLLAGVSRLLEVTSVLAAEIDPTRILETITSEARSALHCERASVYQYDATRNARQVPVERRDRYVREIDIRETIRTNGVTLFLNKKVIAVAGERLPEPKIVQETFPLKPAASRWSPLTHTPNQQTQESSAGSAVAPATHAPRRHRTLAGSEHRRGEARA